MHVDVVWMHGGNGGANSGSRASAASAVVSCGCRKWQLHNFSRCTPAAACSDRHNLLVGAVETSTNVFEIGGGYWKSGKNFVFGAWWQDTAQKLVTFINPSRSGCICLEFSHTEGQNYGPINCTAGPTGEAQPARSARSLSGRVSPIPIHRSFARDNTHRSGAKHFGPRPATSRSNPAVYSVLFFFPVLETF
jgi:hypothetical protein